jgi:2-polyprenyl-6-methoxyphenol hydroxylase-like FAD-dependent oxidoreductase
LITSTLIGRRAVVIGAGMAGLPAARALADYFEHVVVLERDALPLDASYRAGTPQARHTHALLGGGLRAFTELFPGFERDLAGAGAVPLKVGLDLRLERPGYDPFPARDIDVVAYAMSRPLIEHTVRRRVKQHANIIIREHCRAQEIVAAPNGVAVSAIRFENGDGKSETLSTDLVVEASGRGNLTLGFLGSIGRPKPEETIIGVDIVYATAVFAVPDNALIGWKAVMTFDSPARGGLAAVMVPLEGNRWIVTLVGRHGDNPPGDLDGFLGYAQQLRTPTIYDVIKGAEQLGEIARFGFPASVWRHFERIENFPHGLLPLGDSICRFNPVYGQGMSMAAQEACLLHELLKEHSDEGDPFAGLASAFFARAASLIDTPWALAAVPDLADPKTEGQRPKDLAQTLGFSEALNRLAAEDPAVRKLLFEVLHLLKPGSALNDPDLVERVKAVAAQA